MVKKWKSKGESSHEARHRSTMMAMGLLYSGHVGRLLWPFRQGSRWLSPPISVLTLLVLSIFTVHGQALWYSENDLIFQGDTFYIYGDVKFAGSFDTLHHNGYKFYILDNADSSRGSWWINNASALYIDAVDWGRVVFAGGNQEIKGTQPTFFWHVEFSGAGTTNKRLRNEVYTYRVMLNDEVVYLDTLNFYVKVPPASVPWTPDQVIQRTGNLQPPLRSLTTRGMFSTTENRLDKGFLAIEGGTNTKYTFPVGDATKGLFRPVRMTVPASKSAYVKFISHSPAADGWDTTRLDTTVRQFAPSWYHVIHYGPDSTTVAADSLQIFFSPSNDGCLEGIAQWHTDISAKTDGNPPAWSANPHNSWSGYNLIWGNGDTLGAAEVITGNYYNFSGAKPYFALAQDIVPLVNGALEITANITHVACAGDATGAIDITVSGQAPFTFSWNTGATTEDVSGLPAGTYWVTVTDGRGCSKTDTFTITEPPALVIDSITTVDPSGCGTNDGSATVWVSGGTAPYTYSWSNGQTTATATGLGGGSYTVTVTDANGCQVSGTANLTDPAAPIITLDSVRDVSCNGGADGGIWITVTGGTSPYSYSWSNGATTDDITGLSAGSYSVTVTDAGGCTASQSYTVNEPPALVIDSVKTQDPSTCGASDGSATAYVSGGTAPYSYLWQPGGQTTNPATGLSAGLYTVYVTDAKGCIDSATVGLTDPGAPVITTDSVVDISCNGAADGAIYITVTGGSGNYSYSWNHGATTEDVTNLAAGNYSVSVTDNTTGCSATQSYTVTEPPVLVIATDSVVDVKCFGESTGGIFVSISGGTPGYTYSWNNGATTEDLANVPAGTYNLTVTDANGCTQTMTFTVQEPPQLVIALDSTVNVRCAGEATGAVFISVNGGTPGYTYSWDNGTTSEDLTNVPAGNYTVTITDANGCTQQRSFNITEPDPLDTANVQVIAPRCYDTLGSVTVQIVGGVSPYQVSWSNGSTGASLQAPPGTYTATVQDANQCTWTFNIQIPAGAPPVLVQAHEDTIVITYGDTAWLNAQTTGIDNYTWNPDSNLVEVAPGQAYALPQDSTYFVVTGYDSAGCVSTDTIWVFVLKDLELYVPNFFSPNGDGVNENWEIFGPIAEVLYCRIVNRWGNLVYESTDLKPQQVWDGQCQSGPCPDGVYVYELRIKLLNGEIVNLQGHVALSR